jgi:hypothetical protein
MHLAFMLIGAALVILEPRVWAIVVGGGVAAQTPRGAW